MNQKHSMLDLTIRTSVHIQWTILMRALALMLMRTNQTLLLSTRNTDKIKAYSIQYDNVIAEQSSRTVVVRTRDTIEDTSLVEIVEKARFSYLPLKLDFKIWNAKTYR